MPKFATTPVVTCPPLFQGAGVSQTYGNRILKELEQAGRINPTYTPTRRIRLTPTDAEVVFAALIEPEAA